MVSRTRLIFLAASLCALFAHATISVAGPIITLDLGNSGPDITMNSSGVLSTVDDGDSATAGDENTGITYGGFLAAQFSNVPPSLASFTLSGLMRAGAAQIPLPGLVIQNFTSGTYSLYAPDNSLLLQGPVTSSALTGVIGPPGTGGLFTTTLGTPSAGSLKNYILPGTVSVSLNLTSTNGGNGFLVTPPVTGGVLGAFSATAVAGIDGTAGLNLPEPTSIVLLMLGFVGAGCIRGRKSG